MLVVLLVDVASAQSFIADKTSPVVSCRRARDVHIAARCCPEHSCSKLPASPNGDQVDRSQQARGELVPPVDVAMALSSMSLPTGPVNLTNAFLVSVQTSSLERYYRTYKLSEHPVYSRDELVPLIVQHLTQQVSGGPQYAVNATCRLRGCG